VSTALTSASEAPPGPAPGSIAGQFSLAENGAATYTIPIEVPPGRAGLAPSLSLVYRSDGGNGLVGVGFSVGGLSAVTRCPKTIAVDGESDIVRYDERDRFCLDGLELVALPGQVYGHDGTEYRTVPDTFVKVISHRSSDHPSGPSRFTVWSKMGERLEYGSRSPIVPPTADVPIEVDEANVYTDRDRGVARQWGLRRVVDRNGNEMLVRYASSVVDLVTSSPTVTLEHRVSTIEYGQRENGAGGALSNHVTFEYRDRPDLTKQYFADRLFVTSKRLSAITTHTEGLTRLVKRYDLSYEMGLTERSRLRSVVECGSTGTCKTALNLSWQQEASGFALGNVIFLPHNIDLSSAHKSFVDVDFDGIPDVVLLAHNFELDRYEWHVARSGSSLPWLDEVWGVSSDGTAPNTTNVVPINYDDALGVDFGIVDASPTLRVQRNFLTSTGDFGTIIDTGVPNVRSESPDNQARLVDLNGDGLVDVLECRREGNANHFSARFRQPPGGYGELVPVVTNFSNEPGCIIDQQSLLDADGDGAVEVLIATGVYKSWKELAGQGGQWVTSVHQSIPSTIRFGPPGAPISLPARYGDFNGDGLVDYVDRQRFFFNTGTRFLPTDSPPLPPMYYEGTPLEPTRFVLGLVLDYDGDGRDDVLRYYDDTPAGATDLSVVRYKDKKEEGAVPPIALAPLSPFPYHISGAGDFNGDGATDIAAVHDDWTVRFYTNQAVNPDTLVEVHEGAFGQPDFVRQVRIDYGAAYNRYYDLQAGFEPPLYVSTSRLLTPLCQFPVTCSNGPMRVVRRFLDNDRNGGISPMSSSNEHVVYYDDARYDRRLRQWLGFAQRTVVERPTNHDDLITNQRRTSVARYDNRTFDPGRNVYPNLGKLISSAVFTSLETEVTETHNDWALRQGSADGTSVYFSYVREQVVQRRSFDGYGPWSGGVLLHLGSERRTVVADVDPYGNTRTVTTVSPGTESLGIRTYQNDPASWTIGRLTRDSACVTEAGQNECREATWTYDALGRLETATAAKGDALLELTVTFGRDDWGNVDSVEAREERTGEVRRTDVVYEPNGFFPFAVTNALGQTTLLQYDRAHGTLVELVDPNLRHATWHFDGFGRLEREERADGTHTTIERYRELAGPFGPVRTMVWETTPGVSKAGVEYNFTGRAETRYGYGYFDTPSVRRLDYDQYGERVTYATLPLEPTFLAQQRATSLEVDLLGRVVRQTDPDGSTVQQEYLPYGSVGDLVTTTDRRGFVHRHASDNFGRPLRTEDPVGGFLEYTHGRTSTVSAGSTATGESDLVRRVVRDPYGHPVEIFDADAGTTTHEFNAFGELVRTTNALGQSTRYQYDALGRMTHRFEPEGEASWVWDTAPNGIGKLASTTSAQGVVEAYHYDALGRTNRVDTTLDGETFAVSLEYDAFGRVQYTRYPEWSQGQAFELEHVYDDTGHLFEIRNRSEGGTPLWSVVATDEVGRITLDALENGTDTVRTYDPDTLRLTEQRTRVSATDRLTRRYNYDANGNLTSREEREGAGPARLETFLYDEANRLTEANPVYAPASLRTYEYTPTGNLKRASNVGDYAYNDPAHPHAVTHAGPNTFGYDAAGNQTSRPGLRIDYTSFNKPLRYRSPGVGGATLAEFTYDSGRARVAKHAGPIETLYVGGLYERVRNTSTDQVEHKYYVSSPVGVVAVFTYAGPLGSVDASSLTKRFLHTDHLGSVDLITDASGAVVERRSYDPFGRRRDPATAAPLPADAPFLESLGFTHHEQGDEFGLVNMQGRIYDPLTGRFLSADPVVSAPGLVQSWNRYSYVVNNPLSLTDPNGYDWCLFFCEGVPLPGGGEPGGGGGGTGPGPSYPRDPSDGEYRDPRDGPHRTPQTPTYAPAPPIPVHAIMGDNRDSLTAAMATAWIRGASKHADATGFFAVPIENVVLDVGACCDKYNPLVSSSGEYDALWGVGRPPPPAISEGTKNTMAHMAFGLIPGMNTVMAFNDPTAGPWQKAFAIVIDATSVVTFGIASGVAAGAKGAGAAAGGGRIVFRAFNPADLAAWRAGEDLVAKGSGGTPAIHVLGRVKTGYLSASETMAGASLYETPGLGIAQIDMRIAEDFGATTVEHEALIQNIRRTLSGADRARALRDATKAEELLFDGTIPIEAIIRVHF
jgi:RHS repeat-associated protein